MPKKSASSTLSAANLKIRLSARQLGVMFISFLAAHLIVIHYASQRFPDQIVLGNHFFPPQFAALYSLTAITFLVVAAFPMVEFLVEHLKIKLSEVYWLGVFFLVNFWAIWGVARFAEMLGMGIKSWVVAFVLALVFNTIQGALVKYLILKIK